MKPRNPTAGFESQVGALWEARLAVHELPPDISDGGPHEMHLWKQLIDASAPASDAPFHQAGRIAVGLHGTSEMPAHGPRLSRATLSNLATIALRKAP